MPDPSKPFAGFDDYMESREPGWKAKKAAEYAERERREAEELAAILARYGSEEAALAPCEREKVLIAATAHLVRMEWKNYANGRFEIETLDGWHDGIAQEIPASVVQAVSAAYSLPATVTEAYAEWQYWEGRDREIGLINDNTGDTNLGLAAEARREVVRRLFKTELRARSLAEVILRQRVVVESEVSAEREHEQAILADLEALARYGVDKLMERRKVVLA